MTTFLPCPFCGSHDISMKEEFDTYMKRTYQVTCNECEAGSGVFESRGTFENIAFQEAIVSWQTRVIRNF